MVVAGAVLLVAGCARLMDGEPVSVFADPFHVGGLPAVNGYSGLRPDAPPPMVATGGSDDGAVDEVARQSITDIDDVGRDYAEAIAVAP